MNKLINTIVLIACAFIFILMLMLATSDAFADCNSEDDLTAKCNYKIHKPCMSVGDSINCCLK